jgi:hypothetical protein
MRPVYVLASPTFNEISALRQPQAGRAHAMVASWWTLPSWERSLDLLGDGER